MFAGFWINKVFFVVDSKMVVSVIFDFAVCSPLIRAYLTSGDTISFNDDDQDESQTKTPFPKLPSKMPIDEKIEWTVKKFDNNYFLNKPIDSLKHINKNINRLSWIKKKISFLVNKNII